MRNVGMIENRHPLPVESYLLPADAATVHGFHDSMYAAARQAAYIEAQNGPYRLYLTGLTTAALGAVQGMRDAGIPVEVASYDAATGQYVAFAID